jgi:hypothetical protein
MNPALELRAQLARVERRASGIVVDRVGADRYRVSVSGEVIEAIASSNVAFLAGDHVAIRGGAIIGRMRNPATLKSYQV